MNAPFFITAVLALALLGSALGLVYAKHLSRGLFSESESLVSERDRIDIEWRRLQLELASLASHSRIERKARIELQMKVPAATAIVMVRP